MSSLPTGHRRSIRLPGYDYTQAGAYFVTLCTHQGEELFGHVADAGRVLNAYGRIAHDAWLASPAMRREIALDEFGVMPNHMHGIVIIVGAHGVRPVAGMGDEGRMPHLRWHASASVRPYIR